MLSLKSCGAGYEQSKIVGETGKRFLQSASLLLNGQYLGLQFKGDKEGNSQVHTFSSVDTEVTAEDFHWIFHRCADVEKVSVDFQDTLYTGQKVYTLHYIPRSAERYDGDRRCETPYEYKENLVSREYFQQILNEIYKTDASIQIKAGAGADGMAAGVINISLPDEMTLRMRTMISLAIPDTKVEEVHDPVGSSADRNVPVQCLMECIIGLLNVLMRKQYCGKPEPVREYIEFEEYMEEPAPEWDEECAETGTASTTPIDELELSVRAYTYLRRAGIDTVEKLRTLSDQDYSNIRNLSRKCMEEIKQKLSKSDMFSAVDQPAAPCYMDMLNELIGLDDVKEQIRRITAFVRMRKDMEALGKVEVPIVLNMEFAGNPGTAKTTVARIIAGIFNEIGLLSSDELVEAGRADLVARYVGQTADKVKSIFEQAKGKILFIDEAYSLLESQEGDFGDEAINTIVQEMENNRSDTIVIFAGYPDKMEEFFLRNPGLRSRVPFHISFADYSVDEMVRIAEMEAQKRGFSIGSKTRDRMKYICGMAACRPEMGNGRFCRNLVENAILSYASRMYGKDSEDVKKDFTLVEDDFVIPADLLEAKKAAPIGFRVQP